MVRIVNPPNRRCAEEEGQVVAHAGENARKTGEFRCERCHERVHVTQGDRIPKCPNCGNDTFDTLEHEPDTRG